MMMTQSLNPTHWSIIIITPFPLSRLWHSNLYDWHDVDAIIVSETHTATSHLHIDKRRIPPCNHRLTSHLGMKTYTMIINIIIIIIKILLVIINRTEDLQCVSDCVMIYTLPTTYLLWSWVSAITREQEQTAKLNLDS